MLSEGEPFAYEITVAMLMIRIQSLFDSHRDYTSDASGLDSTIGSIMMGIEGMGYAMLTRSAEKDEEGIHRQCQLMRLFKYLINYSCGCTNLSSWHATTRPHKRFSQINTHFVNFIFIHHPSLHAHSSIKNLRITIFGAAQTWLQNDMVSEMVFVEFGGH